MPHIAIIGAGPAGLMAAETLAQAAPGLGTSVHVYDAMPSVGRKLLLAGVGGLNITHAEALDAFVSRYGTRAPQVGAWLEQFSPTALREWVHRLGIETFVGSSQRVFPAEMKAAPLLRAWLQRLRQSGVQFHARHRWLGFTDDGALRMSVPDGERLLRPDATLLALGGASWKKLGSDGAWQPWLQAQGVQVQPLQPANCGFDLARPWSTLMQQRHAGAPLKNVRLTVMPQEAPSPGHQAGFSRLGEFVITQSGVEGSLVYAASHMLREDITHHGQATMLLDLLPAHSAERVQQEVSHPRGSKSLSTHLQSRLKLTRLHLDLLHEVLGPEQMRDAAVLARTIKALPLVLGAPRPIDEAISSAGGVAFEAMNDALMLHQLPGVFCAGEMIDWEAPTGGYLLTACMASGRVAGRGMVAWLAQRGLLQIS